jgi:hypothetical protein
MTALQTLLDGLQVKSRPDGTVHTVKDGEGKTVAEVCVGTKKTRVNFRSAPKGLKTDGKSKSWQGGGVVVDEKNAKTVRAALLAAAGQPHGGGERTKQRVRKTAATKPRTTAAAA